MRLWISPCFRSRRAVSNGGPHLSVAYDLTCFVRFFELYKLCLKSASMKLWIAPSFRSRRVVSNGGLLLSVAYDLTCFIRFFALYKLCFKSASMRLWIAPSFRSRRAVSNGGLLLSVAYDLTCFIRFFELYTVGSKIPPSVRGWKKLVLLMASRPWRAWDGWLLYGFRVSIGNMGRCCTCATSYLSCSAWLD